MNCSATEPAPFVDPAFGNPAPVVVAFCEGIFPGAGLVDVSPVDRT